MLNPIEPDDLHVMSLAKYVSQGDWMARTGNWVFEEATRDERAKSVARARAVIDAHNSAIAEGRPPLDKAAIEGILKDADWGTRTSPTRQNTDVNATLKAEAVVKWLYFRTERNIVLD